MDVFKKSATCPKAIALVAFDLVESFAELDTATFELDVDERETVDENCDIIAVVMIRAIGGGDDVLIDDLKGVVVNIFLVDNGYLVQVGEARDAKYIKKSENKNV